MPFSFPFYGDTQSSIYISANAIIGFDSIVQPSFNVPILSQTTSARIDPWVYDMYHLGTASHYYYQSYSDTMFSISFHDARYYNTAYRNDPAYGKTMQVLLFSDGRIRFQYQSLNNFELGSPYQSGIDDDHGPYELSCGYVFSDGQAITFYPPSDIYLSNPRAEPITGTPTTDFYYYVDYSNAYGLAPTEMQVFVDGTPYPMYDPGGNYHTGVTLDYGPVNLLAADHEYYFNVTLGVRTARLPQQGAFIGPLVPEIRRYCYFENFDTGSGDCVTSDTSIWQWGAPASNPPYSAYSPPNCWGTVIDGLYPDNACASLVSPPIIVQPNDTLSFFHWYDFGSGSYDGGNVKITTDWGSNWLLISPIGGYPGTIQSANACIGNQQGYHGSQTYWAIAKFDLSSFEGDTAYIRWEFGSDASNGYDGWFIDNVVVAQDYYALMQPETQLKYGIRNSWITYTIHLQNCGRYDDTYDLSANISSEPWQTEIWDKTMTSIIDSISIAPGATDSFFVKVNIPGTAIYSDSSRAEIEAASRYSSPPTVYTVDVITTTRMAGNYDVGGGNADFASPALAASALHTYGLIEPVTFNVYSGVYNGQVYLSSAIPGMGSSNPIVFQNAPGQIPIIISPSSNQHGFYILRADYITIQGFEIRNCGGTGIGIYATSSGPLDSVIHNTFTSNYIYNAQFGIRVNYGQYCRVGNNEIHDVTHGIVNTRDQHNLIDNNMIYNTQTSCIVMELGRDSEVIYNSCYESTPQSGYYGVFFARDTSLIVKNNIFYQNGSGYAYSIYSSGPYYLQSDYNDIYAPNGILGCYNFVNLPTLLDFQTATGLDAHSISADPNFMNKSVLPYNLHINLPSPVDSAGIPITGITTDFDGDVRNPSTPDIGADEFESPAPPEPVDDLVITMIDTMSCLQWSPVSGAVQYHIYKSTTDPVTGFSLLGSTTNTIFVDYNATPVHYMSFYYVTSDNTAYDSETTMVRDSE